MKEIKTYDEMNKQICGLLRLAGDNVSLYAAKRIAELEAENDKLRARLENAVELPAIVMIERTLVDGKFKHTQKAQAFNGRIGVVYSDKTRWGGLLVDICSERTFDYEPAKARLAEIKAKAKLKEQGGNV